MGDFTGNNRFGALISALAKDADTNVLSTPVVVTLDNEEAEIVVGQNVPFVTGTYTTSTSSGSDTTSRLGILSNHPASGRGHHSQVKPQINEGNAVKLEISQKFPTWCLGQRGESGADHQQTRHQDQRTSRGWADSGSGWTDRRPVDRDRAKVPLLGDVPLLGNLFRYRNTSKLKRNLMVFLHPVILRTRHRATCTSSKYSYIRQEQLAARDKGVYLLPDVQSRC